jgi:hypothetical protein
VTRDRRGAVAICTLWLVASFLAPAVLLTDALFLALLLSGALFIGLGLWAAVPVIAAMVAIRRLRRGRCRQAAALLALPMLGLLLGWSGDRFWVALRRAALPPSYACVPPATASGACPAAAPGRGGRGQ